MNARLQSPATTPTASAAHDAAVLDVASRLRELATALAGTTTMGPNDAAQVMGELLDELSDARSRLDSVRDSAYRLAELESAIEVAA